MPDDQEIQFPRTRDRISVDDKQHMGRKFRCWNATIELDTRR